MELAAYLPPRLLDEYQPLALLQDRGWRQTLLLRHRRTRLQIICKRASNNQSQLQDEHLLLRQLAGPGIPESLEVFQENGWTYLLRIYVPGETLLDYAQKRGSLPAREVRNIGQEICAILRRLHRQDPPVIHRDIKLENIIRTPEGQLYLIDFGISRRFEAGACRDTQVLGRRPRPRRSSSASGRPTPGPTSTPWACCSTSWPPGRPSWTRARCRRCSSR